MADRYDPKLSVRPLSERKPANPAAAGEDPLVELARIVSGRSTFDPGPAQRAKTVPVNGSAASDAALANDLESELLNDLQASFSSTFYAPSPPPPPPPPVPAAKPAAQAPKPVPPAPAKPAAPSNPSAPGPAQPSSSPSQAEKPAFRLERPTPPPAARADKPVPPPAAAPPKAERSAAPAPQTERLPLPRQVSSPSEKIEKADKIDLPEAQFRPTVIAHATSTEAPPVKSAGRWERERPAEPPQAATPDPSRFAPPPRGAALFRPKVPVAPEPEPEEDELPDLAAFGELGADNEAYGEEGLPPEDLDALQMYGEDDSELPPFPDELEELSSRRPRRGLFAGAAVLALVLAGGVGFLMLRSESSVATPPIITADATPAKVVPADTPSDNDEQNKLIYDRVNGSQSADGTKLVTPGDEPVADSPAGSSDANNPISRVIAPGGPGFDQPAKDGAAAVAATPPADAPAASDADAGSISPKKVRTVVVRPDMTVVSSQAAAAGDAGKAPAAPVVNAGGTPDASPDASPKSPPTDAVADSGKGSPVPVDSDPPSTGKTRDFVAQPASGDPAAPGSVPAGDGDAGAAPAADPSPAADASVAPAKAPTPPTKPAEKPAVEKPVVVATRGGPMDLTPAKAGKPAPASGGVLVQMSAQKSEEAAKSTYHDLQVKYPTILGSLDANIQRADLGEKGVYFRVRVGPFASADAQRICGDLKAAGGSCILAH